MRHIFLFCDNNIQFDNKKFYIKAKKLKKCRDKYVIKRFGFLNLIVRQVNYFRYSKNNRIYNNTHERKKDGK